VSAQCFCWLVRLLEFGRGFGGVRAREMRGMKRLRWRSAYLRGAQSLIQMPLSSLSRVTFAVEAAILAALALESLTLLARAVSNWRSGFVFAAYFSLMLVASISLLVIVLGAFQAREVGTESGGQRLLWIGFAGALVATVVLALDAYFAKPDEGNLSIVALRYVFAPFLLLWLPLIHVWIERQRGGLAQTESQGGDR